MTRPVVLAAAMLAAAAAPTRADIVYGLTNNNEILTFDTLTGVTSAPLAITGAPLIVDLDFYPVINSLYGVSPGGALYHIDIGTGAATLNALPSQVIGGVTEIDFNPAVDRLRVYSGRDNFRLTPRADRGPRRTARGRRPAPSTPTAP